MMFVPFTRVLDCITDTRFPWWFCQWKENAACPLDQSITRKIKVALTFDVEQDSGSLGDGRVEKMLRFLKTISQTLGSKKATLFIQSNLIEEYPEYFKQLNNNYEFGLHCWHHDELWGDAVWFVKDRPLAKKEKIQVLEKSIKIFQKHKLKTPRSFRSPNMVINQESLDVLQEYEFTVDSSFSSFKSWSLPYKTKHITEIPVSSLPVPKVSFRFGLPYADYEVVNMGNLARLRQEVWQQNIRKVIQFQTTPLLVFLAHSWDFDQRLFQQMIHYLESQWDVCYVTMQEMAKDI